ncbi:MAG: ABC transporter permease subunit [Myxococcaceae bacterium]|nr:ABC transporter permease subunit [Myxococcaceae bacterium]MCI0669199.1 ABC transporter permease subunit [Myxococcaceae bacterium]
MSPTWRLRVGLALMGALLLASVLYEPLAEAPFLPTCPFGADPTFPATDTVCGRTLVGLRRSVGVGLLSGGAAAGGALVLALLARRFGRGADLLVEKVADLFFAIPDVLVLILIGFGVSLLQDAWAGFRPAPFLVVVLSLTVVSWAAPTRQIQNRLRTLEGQDFVLAARAVGAGRWRILVRHLLPFAWDYVLAIFLLRVPATILAESTVSFLGFGLPAREASLGTFIGLNYTTLMRGAWGVLPPALLLLFLVVIAFQWTGQGALARASGRSA